MPFQSIPHLWHLKSKQALENVSATFGKLWQGFSPFKSLKFITDLCVSSISMVALTPTSVKCSKLCVHILLIENKTTDMRGNVVFAHV